jgi:hypothetical protein
MIPESCGIAKWYQQHATYFTAFEVKQRSLFVFLNSFDKDFASQ